MTVAELAEWLSRYSLSAPVLVDWNGAITAAHLELPDHAIYVYVTDDSGDAQTVGSFLDRLSFLPPALEVLAKTEGQWQPAVPIFVEAGEDRYDLAHSSVLF